VVCVNGVLDTMTEKKQDIQPADQFKIMDARDENQILSELQGHYLTEFVYSFKAGGRDIIGLSWAGIKEIAYRMKGIQIETCTIEDKADYWMVTCKALDIERRSSRFGVATQSKLLKRKDGNTEPDDFALQKATSKAQRNAIRALIPEITAKQYINQFLEECERPVQSWHREPEQQHPKDVTPTEPQAPLKDRLMNAIRPDIMANIEVVHEDDKLLVLKPIQRLEVEDFKETCRIIEDLGGKYLKIEGIWEIPLTA
jgi:hypothetical protein